MRIARALTRTQVFTAATLALEPRRNTLMAGTCQVGEGKTEQGCKQARIRCRLSILSVILKWLQSSGRRCGTVVYLRKADCDHP